MENENRIEIKITVNGKEYNVLTKENRTLLEVLREDLNLTGSKIGCGKGECGACTVIFNGLSVNSCLILAPQADQAEILTVEGLGTEENPHYIQEAFKKEGAVQCGYCTPGMVIETFALLQETEKPTEDEIKEGLSGNLCRCTGYTKIIKAVKTASEYKEKI